VARRVERLARVIVLAAPVPELAGFELAATGVAAGEHRTGDAALAAVRQVEVGPDFAAVRGVAIAVPAIGNTVLRFEFAATVHAFHLCVGKN
jgi:hypothetical protein